MGKGISLCLVICCFLMTVACRGQEDLGGDPIRDDMNLDSADMGDSGVSKSEDQEPESQVSESQESEGQDSENKDLIGGVEENLSESEVGDSEEDWQWPYDAPENHRLNGETVQELHHKLYDMDVLGAVVVKEGVIVDEYFADGFNKDSVFPMSSASKSVTSTLFGIAIDKGYIEDTDILLSQYFPEIEEKEGWKDISLWHLLTHTAGIDASDEIYWYEWRKSDDWIKDILRRPLIYKPGSHFVYSTGNTHLLTAIMEAATQEEALVFGNTYLFGPLNMNSVELEKGPQGHSDGGNGFAMNLYDMAKIGQLYINGGIWEGQRIVSQEWIDQASSLQFKRMTGSADYGYQWWVRTFGINQYHAFFAQGHGGQFIFVVPDVDLVVVFASDHSGVSSRYWSYMSDMVNACMN